LISALTDGVITAGSALIAAMIGSGVAAMPSKAVWIVCLVGGVVQAARTIQQALKATPETSAALKGAESTATTHTLERTP
jgi:hypothetical protein